MLRNYLLIAFRNLRKYKAFSAINMIGVAVALACFMLLSLYGQDELSYDWFNAHADRTYRTPGQAIGKPFQYGPAKGQIIGVTKDYHFEPLHPQMAALAMILTPRQLNWISVPLKGNIPTAVRHAHLAQRLCVDEPREIIENGKGTPMRMRRDNACVVSTTTRMVFIA